MRETGDKAGIGQKSGASREQRAVKGKDRHFVTALSRGLRVLHCFTRARPLLGVSEIARLIDLPQPTTWRLCHTLIELGYLVQDEGSEKLRPGLPVLGLGYAVLAAQDFGQLARPYMQEIANRYHAGVSLGIRDQNEVLYLQRCIGGSVAFANWTVGSRVPLLESPMGWACLAALPTEARERVLTALPGPKTGKSARLRRGLVAAIPAYKRSGYIVAAGSLHDDVNSAAVPFRSANPGRTLALSCGGLSATVSRSMLEQIGGALLKLSQMLELAVPPITDHRE
jgi:DNA-binding IclR family transcriptional regulator